MRSHSITTTILGVTLLVAGSVVSSLADDTPPGNKGMVLIPPGRVHDGSLRAWG